MEGAALTLYPQAQERAYAEALADLPAGAEPVAYVCAVGHAASLDDPDQPGYTREILAAPVAEYAARSDPDGLTVVTVDVPAPDGHRLFLALAYRL